MIFSAKSIKKITIITIIIGCLCLLSISSLAVEVSPDHTIHATFDNNLRLDPESGVFFEDGNINPGDEFESTIVLVNDTDKTIEFQLSDIINQLANDAKSKRLLSGLEIVIEYNGTVLFQGKYIDAIGLSSQWVSVAPKSKIELKIYMSVPGSLDNTYQGLPMSVNYKFKARMAKEISSTKPSSETTSGSKTGSKTSPKTGMEFLSNTSDLTSILSVVCILGILTMLIVLYLKRKHTSDNRCL